VSRRRAEHVLRAIALGQFVCPDHGCDLEEQEDRDAFGVHVSYRCPIGDHTFGSVYDPVGGYAPADRDEEATT
jgi:hypothetical protein